jgi:CPA1 family monovalent cation:H+ antiporter
MRGVVSLAAALSIPVQLANGTAFPQRNLILFITFIVILLTLLVQGLTLPHLIRKMNLPNLDETLPEEEVDNLIQKQLAEQALQHLKSNYGEELQRQPSLQLMARKWEESNLLTDDVLIAEEFKKIYSDILDQQRQWLITKNKEDKALDEDIVRKHLLRLDIEEEKLRFI